MASLGHDDAPSSAGMTEPLTEASLAEQNKNASALPLGSSSAIRAWAATLPEVPESALEPAATGPSHIFEIAEEQPKTTEPRIQETKDVFTETQKIAYVGLCALTSLEVVHDFQGKEFAYARMSADNWQRKLMRKLYAHMDISPEEIKMIETLSRHNILPSDLVHQFTAQGETTTVSMNGFHKVSSAAAADNNDEFVIDLRWTVMCDLFLLCLSSENYDARSRVFIARMASYLSLDWFQVIGFEKRITEHLMQNAAAGWETETVTSVATTQTSVTDTEVLSVRNDAERMSRNKQRRKKRFVMIGLATIGGGLILGLSAGLMAPVIAGGIGTILSTVGVTGTTGFLGGTAGIALITGSATVTGGGLGAKSMQRRMKTINTFEFSPVKVDDNVSCIISVSGWLPKSSSSKDTSALPFSGLDPMLGDHYTLYWEPEMLAELGSAFKIFATEAVSFSIQQALTHTILGALLAGLAWPLALTKLGYLVDNPWNNGLDRARLAGLILADSLMNRNLGARPVTLIGYSLGARVIFYCLLELARVNAYGLVENVALFGTPVSASKAQWKECTTVVAGRFINGYATSDWLLGFLFRASTAGLGNVAGLRPLEHIEGNRVTNIDCTDIVKGHLNYRTAMPKLLKRAGFPVTSDELPDLVKEKEVESTKNCELDLTDTKDVRPATMTRGSTVSSFSSGKASIQYPVSRSSLPTEHSSTTRSVSPSSSSSSVSSSSDDTLSASEPPSNNNHTDPVSDDDIIAGIIANAAAVSKSSGGYSSLSSGRASIATAKQQDNRPSPPSPLTQSSSEKTRTTSVVEERRRSSSLFSRSSLMFKSSKKKEDEDVRELSEAGVSVKEIKSTLGRMVVPDDVVNPMPKITLEKPQYARINR